MKDRYDQGHRPVRFKVGQSVLLKLHHGYKIPRHISRKFSIQRVGPFKIKRVVGRLAYELGLPPTYRIHPVISIAQLHPALPGIDPYGREPAEPGAVQADGDPDGISFEIEHLLSRRTWRQGGGKPKLQYLVKWHGWGPAHNVWYDLKDLQDAIELVHEYDRTHPDGTPRRRAPAPVPAVNPARNASPTAITPRALSPVVAIPRVDPNTGEPFLERALRPRRTGRA